MSTKISVTGGVRPAPRWWRNFERGMLLVIIPTATAIIQGYGFKNEILSLRLNLFINLGLTALIKFIGMMLVDTEDNYVSNLPKDEQEKIDDINVPPVKEKSQS